jgi:signal peptidase I
VSETEEFPADDAARDPDSAEVTDPPSAPPAEPVNAAEPVSAAERTAKSARWWEYPVLIVAAIGIAVLIKTFLIQPFYIPSESMEKTLHGCAGCAGDRIVVNKPIYHFRDPHPGDIVVFHAPPGWEEPTVPSGGNPVVRALRGFGQFIGLVPPNEKDLVKRVIAVGGQTVRCCDSAGRVQISDSGPNGPWRSLHETYLFDDNHQAFGPVTVPTGRLWVMGDHRSDSADSRAHCNSRSLRRCDPMTSTVDDNKVIGKAVAIVWPPSRWRTLGTPETFKSDTAAAAGSAVPLGTGLALTLPLFWRCRRR